MLRALSAAMLTALLAGCQSPPQSMTDPFVPGPKRIPPPATGSIGTPGAPDPYYQPQGVPPVAPQGAAPATVAPGAFGLQGAPAPSYAASNLNPWRPSEAAPAAGMFGPLVLGQATSQGAARMTISDSRGVYVGDPDQPVGTGVRQQFTAAPVARPVVPEVSQASFVASESAPRVLETGASTNAQLNLHGVPVNDGTQAYTQQRFVPTAQYVAAPAPIYAGQQQAQQQPLIDISTLPPAGSNLPAAQPVAQAAYAGAIPSGGAPATGAVATAGWTVAASSSTETGSAANGTRPLAEDARLYGYDPNYAWLQGKLQYSAADQRWKLRYIPHDAAGGVDQFGGSVTLSNVAGLDGRQSGDLVRVTGSLGARPAGSSDFAPIYHVQQVQSLR